MLHAWLCDNDGHAAPPFAAAVTTERDCDWVPPPQRVEQSVQLDHDDTTQSTGHGCRLHG